MKNLITLIVSLAIITVAQARDQVKIVGSSTVYPFASFVAEEFGSVSRYPTPVVESTGTGGGMKLFCTDNSLNSPDITNASRRIKIKEFNLCERNGVTNITEVMFGYDGIVVAQAAANKALNISKRELLLALAKKVPNKEGTALIDNPYQYWDQINASFPHRKISVYGPPISSGTRDAFEEIVMQYQTEDMKVYRDAGLKGYRIIRSDGVYIPSGENDNLIVKKLTKDTMALGIFGYSFLTENDDMIKGIQIDGVLPTADAIASKEYPVSRSLFFYVKNDHIEEVPAMKEYIEMFLNTEIIGEDGLLSEIGLIPMDSKLIEASFSRADAKEMLKTDHLEDAFRISGL
jgi:phosphate transport system substrate-binding protein